MSVLYLDEDCNRSSESLIGNTIVAAVQRSVEEGTIVYDPSGLPACIEAYSELGCEEVTVGFPEECKQALKGLAEEGETCAHALECDAGFYCGPTCQCTRPAAEGEACFVTAQCEAGLSCFMGACAPLGGEGDPCGAGVAPDCLTGFICVTADEKAAVAGRCFSGEDLFLRREGDDCNALGDPPTLCDEGLACPVALFSKCVPTAPPGGACQLAFPDMCPANEYCSSGTCVPLPGPGEACATGIVVKRPCSAYSRCVNNVLRAASL
jgi:hypothetical protein